MRIRSVREACPPESHRGQSELERFVREPPAEVVTSSRKATVRGLPKRATKAALGLCAGTR